MTTRTVPDDVRTYLSAVRTRLDDLPTEEREDLLADVELSILESAEETEVPVELRLGPPDAFADELRTAAGLPPRAGASAAVRQPRSLRERIAAVDTRLAANPVLRALAPAWWVIRGFIAAGLLDLALGGSVLSGADSSAYVLVMTIAAVVLIAASVAIGIRRPRRGAVIALVNLALVIAAVPVAAHVADSARVAGNEAVFIRQPTLSDMPVGLFYDQTPVENIYGFDRRGRLLQDVRLYDQFGRPISIGGPGPLRRPVETRRGYEIFNAFPIRYFEPGTRRVENPAAGAPEGVRPLATEPLRHR
jgi:uncharacterized membrane protein